MAPKKKIRIYYRAPSHVPLWKVMEEGGFLEKHGLEMDFGSLEGQRKRAAEGLKSGELDVVSGNHHNLYARKALNGDPYVHIAQSNNSWRENYLVMGNGINSLQDLKGKRVAMDDYDGHTGLNVWLYLRQQGLEEGRNVELVTGAKRGVERAKEVMDGKYDATFIRAVDQLRARKLGARIMELPTMAMIRAGVSQICKNVTSFSVRPKRGSILSTRIWDAAPKREIAMRLPLSSSGLVMLGRAINRSSRSS